MFLAAKSGTIKGAEDAADIQNFVSRWLLLRWDICMHSLIKCILKANIGASSGLTKSLGHALKFNDFYHDTVHQFAPTYHDYILYNNEGEERICSRTICSFLQGK